MRVPSAVKAESCVHASVLWAAQRFAVGKDHVGGRREGESDGHAGEGAALRPRRDRAFPLQRPSMVANSFRGSGVVPLRFSIGPWYASSRIKSWADAHANLPPRARWIAKADVALYRATKRVFLRRPS